MLYVGSKIKVIDNSGARFVKCLKILSKSTRSRAKVGDILVVSVLKAIPNKRVKKGEVLKAVVVRVKFKTFRYGGISISFDSNAVILLNNKLTLLGSRVLGPVSRELRNTSFLKVVSLSPGIF